MIKLITIEKMNEIIEKYNAAKTFEEILDVDEGLFISFDNNKFIALANECNDCYVEEFYSLEIALNYLLGNYESLKFLYMLDETFKDNKVFWLHEELDVTRGIKHKDSSKAKELLAVGFNKDNNPELYQKYIKTTIDKVNEKIK